MKDKQQEYTIVIIEDDRSTVLFYEKSLKRTIDDLKIYSFTEVSKDLFTTVTENHINLFIVDIHLGKHNGIDLATDLQLSNPDSTFLFISGYKYSSDDFAYFDGKCIYDFMKKPVTSDELTIRVKALINISKSFNKFLGYIKAMQDECIDLKMDALREKYFAMVKQDRAMIKGLMSKLEIK